MNKKSTQSHVLHITPHIGGGVGAVILNYLKHEKGNVNYHHEVVCLDSIAPQEKTYIKDYKLIFSENSHKNISLLLEKMQSADIVLLHWWNHPLLFDFLVRTKLPACRLIIWSHVSGLTGTNVFTQKILTYPDQFIFTTPISYECKIVKDLVGLGKDNFKNIWSTSGVDYIKKVPEKSNQESFCIGYIGTVDYAKLHPQFIELCNSIDIENKKFVVCGGNDEARISAEAIASLKGDKFEFLGHITDVNVYLSQFDVFAYPLSSAHYGTCDQVLAEAMAAGVVPVVFNNAMECSMVEHGKTGLIVSNKQEYVAAVELLYNDKEYRSILSKNAIIFAREFFSLKKMALSWEVVFRGVLDLDKTTKQWDPSCEEFISPSNVFFESLGDIALPLKNYLKAKESHFSDSNKYALNLLKNSHQWQSKSKGTVHHYLHFFPEDKKLRALSNMMNLHPKITRPEVLN